MKERIITFNDVAGVLNNYFYVESVSTEKYKRSIKWHVNEDTYLLEEKRQWLLSKNDKIIEGITKIKDVYDYIIELKEMLFQIRDVSCDTDKEVKYEKQEFKIFGEKLRKGFNQSFIFRVYNRLYDNKNESEEAIAFVKDVALHLPSIHESAIRCLCSKKRKDFITNLEK